MLSMLSSLSLLCSLSLLSSSLTSLLSSSQHTTGFPGGPNSPQWAQPGTGANYTQWMKYVYKMQNMVRAAAASGPGPGPDAAGVLLVLPMLHRLTLFVCRRSAPTAA